MSSPADDTRFTEIPDCSTPESNSPRPVANSGPSLSQEKLSRFAGRYESLQLVGTGGFSNVYKAYDHQTSRHVALKVLRSEIGAASSTLISDQKKSEILRREASAFSILQHPHIVTLYDLQLEQSPPFLVMEFVEGESLAEFLEEHPHGVNAKQAATIVLGILQAMSSAHSHGILHRDIKPSNVLLDRSRTFRDLSFCPKLADFGLAKNVDQDTLSLSQDGFVGTITFAPPELLNKFGASHSERSDIYSLGCILYCLLNGRKPFEGATFLDVIQQIKDGTYTPLTELASVPKDLIAICEQAMALEPVDRYATATRFAEDLERFLSNKPVLARRAPIMIRSFRWMQRHAWETGAACSLIFAVVSAAMLLLWNYRQLQHFNSELDSRNTELTAALEASQNANFRNEQIIYVSDLNQAANEIEAGNHIAARAILDRYDDTSPLVRHRDVDWFLLRQQTSRTGTVLAAFDHPLYVGRWDPNTRRYYVGGANGRVICIDPESRTSQTVLSIGDSDVNAIAWTTDPSDAWISSDDGTVQNWDLVQGKLLSTTKLSDPGVKAFDILLFSALNKLVVFGNNDRVYVGPILRSDAERSLPTSAGARESEQTDSLRRVLPELQRAAIFDRSTNLEFDITSVAPGPDEQTFLAGTNSRHLLTVNAVDFEIQQSIRLVDSKNQPNERVAVDQVIMHPEKIWAACTTPDFYLSIADLRKGEVLSSVLLPEPPASVQWMHSSAGMSPANEDIVSVDRSTPAQILMVGRHNAFARYSVSGVGQLALENAWTAENERIYGLLFNSTLDEFVTLSKSGRVQAWGIDSVDTTGKSATFKVDSPLIWNSVCFWDDLGQPDLHEERSMKNTPLLILLQSEGQVKAYVEGAMAQPVVIAEGVDNVQIGRAGPHGMFLASPDRLRLLSSSAIAEIVDSNDQFAMNLSAGWREIPLSKGSHPIERARRLVLPMVSGDGQWIAGYDSSTEEVWFSRWGSQEVTKSFPAREVSAVHFCEVNQIWWWNDRYSIFSWKNESSEGPQRMLDLVSLPRRITSSRDGRYIAASDSYGGCYVWDEGGNRLTNLKFPHTQTVSDVSFSSTGRTLMTLTDSGVLRCWNLESGRCSYSEKNQEPQQKRYGGFLGKGNWLMRELPHVIEGEMTIERLPDGGT
ncbi:protein kinase domain-containing protein [Pirellulaceae bacterium SH449]